MKEHFKFSKIESRKWRKQVSGDYKYTRTLQFPLVFDSQTIAFEDFENLYNIINGAKKGTLAGLICALYLCGFKLFADGKAAVLSYIKHDAGFDNIHVSGVNETFTPNILYKFITAERRGKNDFVNEKTIESNKKQFLEIFFKDKKDRNDVLQSIIVNFFDFLKTNYRTYSEFKPISKKQKEESKKVFIHFIYLLKEGGFKIEDGKEIFERLQAQKSSLPQDSTIIFVPNDVSEYNLQKLGDTPYLMHFAFSHFLKNNKDVKNFIPGSGSSSLSWLFGKGLQYWQKTDLEKIYSDYGIPREYGVKIKELKEWFNAIDTDKNILSNTLADYRTDVGGTMTSWLSNYKNRLEVLKNVEKELEIPSEFSNLEKSISDKFIFSIEEIKEGIKNINENTILKSSLFSLLGKGEIASEQDIKNIEEFREYFNAILGQINSVLNILSQENYDGKFISELKKITDKTLPKLNKFSGGTPNPKKELDEAKEKFNALSLHMYDFAKAVLEEYSKIDVINFLEEQEKKKIEDSGKNIKNSPRIQAKRLILQRLSNIAKNENVLLGIVYSRFKTLKLFETTGQKENKLLNKFLKNKKGNIYKSPFSRRTDEAHLLNKNILENLDVMELIKDISEELGKELFAPSALRAYLSVKHLYFSLLLDSIEDKIPESFIKEFKFLYDINMPKYLLKASDGVIKKSNVINIFNYCKSELNGYLYVLLRDSFIIRTKFTLVGKNSIYLTPKEVFKDNKTTWAVPALYGGGLFKDIKNLMPAEILSSDQLKEVLKEIDVEKDAHRKFLTQIPHDFYIDLSLKSNNVTLKKECFEVSKGKVSVYKNKKGCFARLICSPQYFTALNQTLYDSSKSIGDYTLLAEQSYRQTYSIENGVIKDINITPDKLGLRVHFPINEVGHADGNADVDKTVIGIDLGEAGIGYSVFEVKKIEEALSSSEPYELKDLKPLAYGTKAIGSIRKLMKKVDKYRKNKQRRQKFQKQYSSAQAQFRQNVAGDIAHHVDKLCYKYKGFPVFESNIGNLSGGANKIRTVYDKVLHMYTYSQVDAHCTERKAHWMQERSGAAIRKHSVFKQFDKEGKKEEPLKLFLGRAVGAASTSQACSKCGRNPLLSFENKFGRTSKTKNISVNENSSVQLADGVILLRQENKTETKKNTARKFDVCLEKNCLISAREGYDALKKQLRQRPVDLRSKDTTQSQYYCPYDDCGKAEFTLHADANAAINIVRKWVAVKQGLKIKKSFWKEKENIDNDENNI